MLWVYFSRGIYTFKGLDKIQVDQVKAGDIIAVAGLENITIGVEQNPHGKICQYRKQRRQKNWKEKVEEEVRKEVVSLCSSFPIYKNLRK